MTCADRFAQLFVSVVAGGSDLIYTNTFFWYTKNKF